MHSGAGEDLNPPFELDKEVYSSKTNIGVIKNVRLQTDK